MTNIIVLLLIIDSITIIFFNSAIDFINFQSLMMVFLFGFHTVADYKISGRIIMDTDHCPIGERNCHQISVFYISVSKKIKIHMHLGIFKFIYIMVLVLWFQISTEIGQSKDQLEEVSQVSFIIKSFGINIDGNFQDCVILVEMDTLSLEDSYIHARIPVATIETGIGKRDKHLLEEKYFSETEYPDILYESMTISRSGKATFIANGLITIKGVQQSISIPFQLVTKSNHRYLVAEFELNRLDFGVGTKSWTMSDVVKIAVSHEF